MWRSATRDLAVVLGASWFARIVFVAAIGDTHSVDVEYWEGALDAQDAGKNPYETGVLNWPPLWLIVIVGLDWASNLLDVAFLSVLRVFLVLVESALVTTLYFVLISLDATRASICRALLVGIALNPVAILLVCQHGNSDVIVGLLVTLAIAALIGQRRSRDGVFWLFGCLLLGIGVLAKTVPLVLAPVLAPGARIASWVERSLGSFLFVGPAALGVCVILVLTPSAVLDHVIGYRSTRGFFGVSGLLDEHVFGDLSGRVDRLTGIDLRASYPTAFTLAVLLGVLWLGGRLWREPLPQAERLFLLVAVTFLAVVGLGPGYGPQYAYWLLPSLVATYALLDDGWRRLLLVAFVVSSSTYAIEYAFVPWLGAYAEAVIGDANWVADVSAYLDTPQTLTLLRTPLFCVYLALLVAGGRRLIAQRRLAIAELKAQSSDDSDGRTSPPEASRAAIAPGRSG
jgi:hypothetical protein